MTDNPQPPPPWAQIGGAPAPAFTPPPAPQPPPPRPPVKRLLPALVGLAAVLVLAGTLTVAVLRSRSTEADPTEAAAPPPATSPSATQIAPAESATPTETTDTTDTTDTADTTEPLPPPTTYETPADDAVPQGFHRVRGPGGIAVAIPRGWPVKPGAIPSNRQADAPYGGGLVRYGGSPSTTMSLYDTVAENETANPNVIDGYQRLRLESVYGYGSEAVDWEFMFIKDGELRHGLGRYWRLNGTDYVVYASSPESSWQPMIPIVDTMIATAQPV